jgi:hypothetical protein
MRFRYLVLAISLSGCVADVPRRASTIPAAGKTTHPSGRAAMPAPLLARIAAAAPRADRQVLALALRARQCAIRRGLANADSRLAVIDYSQPSTERRLWVFDLDQPRLLFDDYVAHGRGSGENLARTFSNKDGSLQSSIGLFRTGETYVGGNGYSLRMDGLEPGVNDNARSRLLVMHGAWYVDPLVALKQGRLGRSYGCPALRPQVAHAVIDTLKQGQLLLAYYPDGEWLATSRFLHCDGKPSDG